MKLTRLSLAIAASSAIFTVSTAYAENWRMATPYPEQNFHTQNIKQFAADIKEATQGKLNITVHPGGSLIKPMEIKNATRSRQIEMGEFILSGMANEHPLFALDSVPFLATSHDASWKLYQISKPALEELLDKQNLKLLYSVAWPPQGMYTTTPVSKLEDLSGMRMRAYSPQTERLAQLSGAVPTQIEATDVAQAFSTGRVNAMITSSSTGVNSAAWDFLKYYYDVQAFLPKNAVVVNKRSWSSLDEDTQKAVLAAAAKAEERGWELSKEDMVKQNQTLIDNGIELSPGSEELRQALLKIGTQMAAEWSKEAGAEGEAILKEFNQ
ncbi:Solute-binding protein [Oligella urethralis]|uniref:TRAP transporter substrate-binding protein n=1 Tax=Oligella urethralis TaxID=90245 RepID=UPI000E062843|nr:TRAP transporter substrate-binding protein [Oligella urethralis]WOS36524.1 Solute-binding protein [Oligella urethralis]SUA64394.1 C4-dicarboxylate-binding periplasmic protein precursor [Oligella urethralis]